MHTVLFFGNLKSVEHFEDLVADERIILKWILRAGVCEILNSILLNEDCVQWRTLVNMTMNLRASNVWKFLDLRSCYLRFCSVELVVICRRLKFLISK
jgi:hypothetical protein